MTATLDLTQLLRLEIERPPAAGELVNLVQNPDGKLGAWAWVTPVAGAILRGGVLGLVYTSPGGAASYFYTEPMPVTPGRYVAASWLATSVTGTYTAKVEWLAGDGTVLSSTAATTALGGSGTRRAIGSYLVPVSTVYCRLRFDHYNASAGNPAAGAQLWFSNVTLTEATTSAGVTWTRTNLMPTPSGEAGVGGWFGDGVTVAASTAQAFVGTKSLMLTKTGGDGAGAMSSVLMDVTPGGDYAFQARLRAGGTVRQAKIAARWFKADGTIITTTEVKKRTETAGAWSDVVGGVVTAPTAAASVRMRVEFNHLSDGETHYVDAVMVEKSATVGTYFDGSTAASGGVTHAWTGTAQASPSNELGPAGDPGVLVPIAYQNIMGPTSEITVDREDLNVGTLGVKLFDAILDPTQDDLIATGKRVRLVTTDGQVIFAGKVQTASVAYHLLAKDASKVAEVNLSAVDAITALASSPRREGVATINELPYVLEGAGVPWSCNGSGQQVATATVVAYNDNASALDQVAVTRDTVLGYAWVDRNGVLQAWDAASLSSSVAATLDESTYTADLNVDFDLDSIINTVTLRVLRVIGTTGATEEVSFGPYADADSVLRYGEHAAEYVVAGFDVTDTAGIAAHAATILAANATPRLRANTVVVPITSADVAARGLLDLYDLVHVINGRASLDETTRVRSVHHDITPGKWLVTLGFTGDGSVAPATSVPAPPPGVGVVKTQLDSNIQAAYDLADSKATEAYVNATATTISQTAANGRSKVTYSASTPGTTANAAGDIWFQKNVTTQTIVGQWQGLGGNSWQQVTLNDQVIANLDAGKLVAGSAFTTALWVKTNFTLGDASTNGVIQSYNFASSPVGVFIDKNGIVAKGGSVIGGSVQGATVEGGLFRTNNSGQRIEIDSASSRNWIKFINGVSGEYLPTGYGTGVPGITSDYTSGVQFLTMASPQYAAHSGDSASLSLRTFPSGGSEAILQSNGDIHINTIGGSTYFSDGVTVSSGGLDVTGITRLRNAVTTDGSLDVAGAFTASTISGNIPNLKSGSWTSASLSAGGTDSTSISFSFGDTPNVTVSAVNIVTAENVAVVADNVSTSGFTIRVKRIAGSGTIRVSWIATTQ